jgi:hypothetical protein
MPSGTYTNDQHVMAGLSSSGSGLTARYDIGAINTAVCAGSDWFTIMADGTSAQYVCSGQTYNSANFPAGVRTHLSITYNGSLVKFYKDGILTGTVVQTVSGAGNAQPFSIGRVGGYAASGYFYGAVDEALIVNRSLSADEIYQLYLGGANRTVGGKWHRIASADGLQSMAFNLTDHNNTFEGADYDMRTLTVNGTSEDTVSASTSPPTACYTRQNTSHYYACSYDQSELSSARSSGIVYSGGEGGFISLCNDARASEYNFNVTALGALKSVIPLSAASCSIVANQSEVITRLGLPTRPFGSYSISGEGLLHMSLQYDRIYLNGTDRFGPGSHRICIEKSGRQGSAALVSVRGC